MTLALTILMSCQQNDGPNYSCDKDVDKWVKDNINTVHKMTRDQWLNVDQSFSKATYRAFLPTQCLNFWLDKINEILNFDWTQEELEHIYTVKNFILDNPEIFNEELTDRQLDEVDLFLYKWTNKAYDELGWSKQMVYAFLGCGNKVLDKDGKVEPLKGMSAYTILKSSTISGSESGNQTKSKCDCNTESDWCGFMFSSTECKDTKCEELSSTKGCGLLLLYTCNGECEPY